jgi:peptidoglycan/LPS O-acetylase OafA/YrhL
VTGVWLAILHRAGFSLRRFAVPGICFAALVFVATAPRFHDQVEIISGTTFLFLAAATIGLVTCAAHVRVESVWGKRLCEASGNASYALYLLHPLLFLEVIKWRDEPWVRLLATVVVAVPLSLLVYRFYERPLMGIRLPLTQRSQSGEARSDPDWKLSSAQASGDSHTCSAISGAGENEPVHEPGQRRRSEV